MLIRYTGNSTRETYEFLLRQFRIADNAASRAYADAYGGRIIPPQYEPAVLFAVIGVHAVESPLVYWAACSSRLYKRGVDPLPVSDGKYRFMMWEKHNRAYLSDIPF